MKKNGEPPPPALCEGIHPLVGSGLGVVREVLESQEKRVLKPVKCGHVGSSGLRQNWDSKSPSEKEPVFR